MKFHNKRIISNGTTYFQYILENFFGYGEFLPSSALMDMFADLICDEDSLPQMCESIIFLLCGFDSGQANLTLIDTIVHHTPAGSSSKTLVHYAQEMGSGNFNSKCIFKEINFRCNFYILEPLCISYILHSTPNLQF